MSVPSSVAKSGSPALVNGGACPECGKPALAYQPCMACHLCRECGAWVD